MPLSSSISDIEASYDVVVVGSGYGAAIAASRLARAGKRVCVLERGREFAPGDFPEQADAALPEFQVDSSLGHEGSRLGLYDLHLEDEVNVLVGCGLGGTSLINANVAIEPDPRVFLDGRWPHALVADMESLSEGLRRATAMLEPNPYPDDMPKLAKLEAHRKSAVAMGLSGDFVRVPINVHFKEGINAAGVRQYACTLCGNCVSGCNVGAKNTLMMNYLPDAKRHGASIFTRAEVQLVKRTPEGRWAVHYLVVGPGRAQNPEAPTPFVLADIVVLGAGTLGSTGILLRSRPYLSMSEQLGQHFTGNGDMLAFSYDPESACNAIGWAVSPEPADYAVGPTITSGIRVHDAMLEHDVLIEEGAIPSVLEAVATLGLATLAEATEACTGGRPHRAPGEAAKATQTYLVMSLDDDRGRIELDANAHPRVHWPSGGQQADLTRGDRLAQKAATGIGGTYLRNPIWSPLLGDRLVTVHPLGGCAMGDDGSRGVVDHLCRVFDGDSSSVHPGLYVCDGAVIPSPLGVNPLLTICAIAERACAEIARAQGWTIDYSLPGDEAASSVDTPKTTSVGVEFTEEMRGFFAPGAPDFDTGFLDGEASGASFEFRLTIGTDDLRAMVTEPSHEARITGTATALSLSPEPLTVTDGVFNLFYEDPARPGLRFMRYRMRLTSVGGDVWFFDGFKHIGNDSPTAAYFDSRTLFITLSRGDEPNGPAYARGRLQIGGVGMAQLLKTFSVTNATSWFDRVAAATKFFTFFAGTEIKTYLGGIRSWWHPHAPPGSPPADPEP